MIVIMRWLVNGEECYFKHEVFHEFLSAYLASSTDGESIEVRADKDRGWKRRGDRIGRSESDATDEHRRDLDPCATRNYPMQKRRLQELDKPRGIENGEPLALPQNHLPHLCNRRADSLDNRLHVSRSISNLVTRRKSRECRETRMDPCSSIWKQSFVKMYDKITKKKYFIPKY